MDAHNSDYEDRGGIFVMRHRANSMSASTSTSAINPEDVWFVDSAASNHMMSHKEWFHELRELERHGYGETGEDTTHSIRHISNVPFGEEGKQTYIKNVLHVPTIMKNLVSVGQMLKQGMQVRFDQDGCFTEKQGLIIAHERREGHMFILDSHEMKLAMFAKSTKINSDIELWHKRIGHINLKKLKEMKSKVVVIGFPTFKEKVIQGICEACQFGKQHRHPFPKERNVSKGLLDVVHSDVWGPTQTTIFGGADITCS